MSKPIFYDCLTNAGNKSINIENIASIENINNKTIITLNVKRDSETNISFEVNLPWENVASAVKALTL
ncbi:hypothetical protein OAC97_03980 [Flavobacteriaceae bacterium]|nr:hypothetical protein [Flavobacteriaceae bacterium]MDB9874396.1 hypothetical protein [Flavobacteriaceae bacterium]